VDRRSPGPTRRITAKRDLGCFLTATHADRPRGVTDPRQLASPSLHLARAVRARRPSRGALAQAGPCQQQHERACRDQQSQGGREAVDRGERADRGWTGAGAEIADRGDADDRDAWRNAGEPGGRAERGRRQCRQSEPEQRSAEEAHQSRRRGDRNDAARGARMRLVLGRRSRLESHRGGTARARPPAPPPSPRCLGRCRRWSVRSAETTCAGRSAPCIRPTPGSSSPHKPKRCLAPAGARRGAGRRPRRLPRVTCACIVLHGARLPVGRAGERTPRPAPGPVPPPTRRHRRPARRRRSMLALTMLSPVSGF
jgi:hypothetical protein